jgi:hypothetical protein
MGCARGGTDPRIDARPDDYPTRVSRPPRPASAAEGR